MDTRNNSTAVRNSHPQSAPLFADIQIENHGSIFLFRINSSAAHAWVSENVQDDAQFFGDGLVVEHRYAADLAAAMQAAGLVLA